MNKKTSTSRAVAKPSVLPRPEITDAKIIEKIKACSGFPTKVANELGMTLADLLVRAKASPDISGAFIEMRQRTVDLARAQALKVAIGSDRRPPDAQMLRWYIERYE